MELTVTTLGDWELNAVHHTDALILLKGLPDNSVDAIITDPPYGVGSVSNWRLKSEQFAEIAGNDGIYADWLEEAFRVTSLDGALYLFASWQNVDEWKAAIVAAGFHVRNMIIWDKMRTGMCHIGTCYAPEYELVLFAVKGRHVLRGARPSDVIHCPKVPPNDLVHPYEKPISLLERFVLTSSDIGDLVVDPFAGSGTTGVAAIKNGRRFIGCDVSAEYAALANNRLAQPYTLPLIVW